MPCCKSHAEHDLPETTYDTALPAAWLKDVRDVLGENYVRLPGHVVWSYAPPHACFGAPLALCHQARLLLDAYTAWSALFTGPMGPAEFDAYTAFHAQFHTNQS